MQILTLVLASMISTQSFAQAKSTPLIIEESSRVLGDGTATDLKPKALEELYRQARISDWGVKQGFKSGKTIILEQVYVVYPFDSLTPTKIKRKVALNQSIYYGDIKDTECAVKILQEGTFDPNGNLVGASFTQHIEVPKCEGEKKIISTARIKVPLALPEQENLTPIFSPVKASVTETPEKIIPVITPASETVATQTPTPTPLPRLITPEEKKDCSEERTAKVKSLYSSDSALQSLEAELQSLKYQNSTSGDITNDSEIIQNVAKEIEKFPVLHENLNKIIAEVYKTHKCPINNVEGWDEFKNVSMRLYQKKEHKKIDMLKILASSNQSAFYCGYNDSYNNWHTGSEQLKNNTYIQDIDTIDGESLYTKTEDDVYQLVFNSQGSQSYRNYEGTVGDGIYFKIANGIYLIGGAAIKNKKNLKKNGFYSNVLLFTNEFFGQSSTPIIGKSIDQTSLINQITQKIESRKQELDHSVPPCEDKKIPASIPIPTSSQTTSPVTREPLTTLNQNSKSKTVSSPQVDPTANIDLTKYIFGKINKNKIVFMIDTSISFSEFKIKVISSIQKTIQELSENQEFTIVFLTQGNVYFNEAKLVPATIKNKQEAIEFLNHVPIEHGAEPIKEAIDKIKLQNGNVDSIYLFGDGDCDFSSTSDRSNTKLMDRELTLKTVSEYGVPITARSGKDQNEIDETIQNRININADQETLGDDLIFLQKMVDATHGINIKVKL